MKNLDLLNQKLIEGFKQKELSRHQFESLGIPTGFIERLNVDPVKIPCCHLFKLMIAQSMDSEIEEILNFRFF